VWAQAASEADRLVAPTTIKQPSDMILELRFPADDRETEFVTIGVSKHGVKKKTRFCEMQVGSRRVRQGAVWEVRAQSTQFVARKNTGARWCKRGGYIVNTVCR
jgi:hypothetical protein